MNEIGPDRFAAAMELVNAPDPRDNPREQEYQQIRQRLDDARLPGIKGGFGSGCQLGIRCWRSMLPPTTSAPPSRRKCWSGAGWTRTAASRSSWQAFSWATTARGVVVCVQQRRGGVDTGEPRTRGPGACVGLYLGAAGRGAGRADGVAIAGDYTVTSTDRLFRVVAGILLLTVLVAIPLLFVVDSEGAKAAIYIAILAGWFVLVPALILGVMNLRRR